jgi:hypothetical protein
MASPAESRSRSLAKTMMSAKEMKGSHVASVATIKLESCKKEVIVRLKTSAMHSPQSRRERKGLMFSFILP